MGGTGERRVLLGRVTSAHGVSGWVRIESWTDPRRAIFDYSPWILRTPDGAERRLDRVSGRPQGKGLAAQIPGSEDRDQALALVGSEILVPREALPSPADGSIYWVDLEGLSVATLDGQELGTVSHLIATGANDVLVVRGDRERLIPFLRDSVVRDIDFDAGRMRVDWDPDF